MMVHLFTDFGHISTRQHVEVRFQGASLDHSIVTIEVQIRAKEHVVTESSVLDPSLLSNVCD